MATFTNTAKYALRWLTGTNLVNDIDAGFQALAEDIDGKMVGYSEGTSQPTSTSGTPGVAGREFRHTGTGQVSKDHGTGWNVLPVGIFQTSVTWDPPSLAHGSSGSVSIAPSAAVSLGDIVLAGFSGDIGPGLVLTGGVVFEPLGATNLIYVTLANLSGATVNLASGTLKVTVLRV